MSLCAEEGEAATGWRLRHCGTADGMSSSRDPHSTVPEAPARQAGHSTSATTTADGAAPDPPYHLIPDLLRGLFKGAYAVDRMHTPGLLVWIAVGFIPVAGTLAAMRDAYYSLEVRSWGALALNLIGLLPFMKGFTNLVEVSQLHRVHRIAHTAHQVAHVARHGRGVRRLFGRRNTVVTGVTHEAGAVVLKMEPPPVPPRNGAAGPAVLLGFPLAMLVSLLVVVIPDFIASGSFFGYHMRPAVAIGVAAGALAASFGALALARQARHLAHLLAGKPFARPFVALVSLWLAWYAVAVSVVLVVLVLVMVRGAF
jgi:hypothetical protein